MAWFQRDHTGRDLRPLERELVAALATQLAELRAPQIDEGETALTAEREHCLIALIPHRALGGISIVVWLFADRARVVWAQVAGLDQDHDSLDLGVPVGDFDIDAESPAIEPILACVRSQVHQPLTLRCVGSDRATVLVPDHRGRLCRIGSIGRRARWSDMLRRRPPVREVAIRLSDPEPPPVTSPSGVDEWF